MAQKIYTRTGDQGLTSLLGGTRVPKHHLRIEAYGSVDELNTHIGLVRDLSEIAEIESVLHRIQDFLFHIGSHLANDTKSENIKLKPINALEINTLENTIDDMTAQLQPMTHFILPGGHPLLSHTHIARCVCRRAERAVIRLHETEPVNADIITYLNRLSDYLFVLSRFFAKHLQIPERLWRP